MPTPGWKQLMPSTDVFRGAGRYPIDAYSEFMPPPRLGWKAYCGEMPEAQIFDAEDPWGWYVSEYEEEIELKPGLAQVAEHVVRRIRHLLQGDAQHAVSKRFLTENAYWSPELAESVGKLPHEKCVLILPLALSRTQDDKGRVKWTLFGNSEQGPARAFWRSFLTAPETARTDEEIANFFCHLLRAVYKESADNTADLIQTGFRILGDDGPPIALWDAPPPTFLKPYMLHDGDDLAAVKYLLTFRPFGRLPEAVRKSYLAGRLHLLPSPASLVFWGVPRFHRMFEESPLVVQAPLMQVMQRKRDFGGLRVEQAGLIHESKPGNGHTGPAHPELVRNTIKRTHRWDKILRDADELEMAKADVPVVEALFSVNPDRLGLYDKPMARNAQIWTPEGTLLLDGPAAKRAEIKAAEHEIVKGGEFGYRFQYPAMRVGTHAVYWHRPLVAYVCPDTNKPVVLPDAPLGYLTAYPAAAEPADDAEGREEAFRAAFRISQEAIQHPVELWPRVRQRPLPLASLPLYHQHGKPREAARNIYKLFTAYHLRDNRPLPRTLAEHLLRHPHKEPLTHWLESLATHDLTAEVAALIEPETKTTKKRLPSLTFGKTARRQFEVTYWKTIATLAEGVFLNKNNADCVLDNATQHLITYPGRHLDALGDYLLDYYRKKIAAAKMAGEALTGSLPFRWSTDLDFKWMGGWDLNQERPAERNLLTVIPGRDRSRAVIMADHYDTAYMADSYEKCERRKGARLSACGADDNHSATAALMLAAPIFLEMSKKGTLGCDIWLIHLTGEEFPADCLGARHLTQSLVEGTLTLHLDGGETVDLSNTRVDGVYVSDMIAHNNFRDNFRDIFQIAPGTSKASFRLAEIAHEANMAWNAGVPAWNQRTDRKDRGRGRRSPYGNAIPETARHLALTGEVRPPTDTRSTLYNTDGQIFSDAGVPVVLFMEDYDINREGYHDTHDTMANIDLDYGSALAAIVIESVARAACAEPPG